MVTPELQAYVNQLRKSGTNPEHIKQQLIGVGWDPGDVEQALSIGLGSTGIPVPQKPNKSTLWIGSNVGAGAVFVAFFIKIIGGLLLGAMSITNPILALIASLLVTIIGIFLGLEFGISYALKRAQIIPAQVNGVSIIAAVIPPILLALGEGLGAWVNVSYGKTYQFDVVVFTANVVLTVSVTYFIARWLLNKSLVKTTN